VGTSQLQSPILSRLSLSEFLKVQFENYRDADADGSDTLSVEEVVEAFNK
jgi:hypothetical protein